ncbi:heavy metal translocating P-type ATPase [Pseudoglutamicibacter albus]|uniref:heavy metal translocating P-type ATPase n=1 Tax=Pseudoglutamicibacter albus TaxID=98671 RepID=UPI000C76780B|nr:heavy metal translocating P-type ATPase [Pseudoglutamicibacter albus]PKY79620.1 heavy metal translocating P-type ATPase [Pseudoglutamicibacter albus]WIK83620.1 heavy metal translocating P-type ATPase [Pseudoglutamicibacter albus]
MSETQRAVTLDIDGMTCASCVNRIERKLGKLPGVTASVNLPLETARVTAPADVEDSELIEVIRKAGYDARVEAPKKAPATNPSQPVADPALADPTHPDPTSEHGSSAGYRVPLFKRFLIAAILTAPVLVISMVPGLQFPHWGWVAGLFSLPVATWAAWPFHKAAAINARHGTSTMDTLVSIGVTVATIYSWVQLLRDPAMTAHARLGDTHAMHGHDLYFESAAVIVTFLLLGRWLEARARHGAADATRALLELGASHATVVDSDGGHREVSAEDLAVGDVILVRPGEKIAADGVVIEGHSDVDASVITGESVPVPVAPGVEVTGATINTSGRLLVRVTAAGEDSTLAAMGRLIAQAQSEKTPLVRLVDRISGVFVPVVLALAMLTFVGWWVVAGDPSAGFIAAVTVLVVACPCALGLATPVALVAGIGNGASRGILISGPAVLEEARHLDAVVLDKTGTITEGRMTLTGTHLLAGAATADINANTALALAAALERNSEHPIARAIVVAADDVATADANSGDFMVEDFASHAGSGVSGVVAQNGMRQDVAVGTLDLLAERGMAVTDSDRAELARLEREGMTVVALGVGTPRTGGRAVALLSVADQVKPDSSDAIARLTSMGVTPWMVTGDNREVAAAVAREVGIPEAHVMAGVKPEGKVDAVRSLQADGAKVAMVGDGVNDAPALTASDLGLAMGAGTDVAREAAGVTLMGSSLGQAADAIELSRQTLRIIRQNIFWAFFYNVAALPVAVMGLLNPMIAGIAMAASSVIVVLNALRLRRFGQRNGG